MAPILSGDAAVFAGICAFLMPAGKEHSYDQLQNFGFSSYSKSAISPLANRRQVHDRKCICDIVRDSHVGDQ